MQVYNTKSNVEKIQRELRQNENLDSKMKCKSNFHNIEQCIPKQLSKKKKGRFNNKEFHDCVESEQTCRIL